MSAAPDDVEMAQGDRVVLEGTDRLRDGSEVEVVNDAQAVPTGALPGQPGAVGAPKDQPGA